MTLRRGGLLVEMLVIMVALLAVLGMSAMMFVLLFRTETAVRQFDDALARRGPLAEAFRADVHRADGVDTAWNQFDAGPECLILRVGERRIVWDYRHEKLVRHEGDSKTLFQLPGTKPPVFEVQPDRMILRVDGDIVAARRKP